MNAKRKLIVYIAASVDGFIAKTNDDLSFLSMVEKEGEDYGYGDFIRTVDTVIIGRRTYDWVMQQVAEFPHADKNAYVITTRPQESIGKTHFYTGSLVELVDDLKLQPGNNIFCDGGAQIIDILLKEKLIDELIVSLIPVLLGEGTSLFKDQRPEQRLELISVRHFEKGLVQLHYKCIS
jgi:dihydrofolate reductase